MTAERIKRIDLRYYRYPLPTVQQSRVGRFAARQSLIVRIERGDGAFGWGEIWCNFPDCGGEHRHRLAEEVAAPWFLGQTFESPETMAAAAREALRLVRLQCDEPGPVNQILAGFDCALWDLLARSRGEPLAITLGADQLRPLPAYASNINPGDPVAEAQKGRARGFSSFKLKIGFDNDEKNLDAMREFLGADDRLMVDVNQKWDPDSARRHLASMAGLPIDWVEEPLPADEDDNTLADLAASSPFPLAGGENVTSLAHFNALIERGIYAVIQPDVAKWGGHSRCLGVARTAIARGLRYCPHYLAGGIGLLHSAHLLAAAGGDGMLEVDNNDNPLRDTMMPPLEPDADGKVHLDHAPGIGADPDLAAIDRYLEGSLELRR